MDEECLEFALEEVQHYHGVGELGGCGDCWVAGQFVRVVVDCCSEVVD